MTVVTPCRCRCREWRDAALAVLGQLEQVLAEVNLDHDMYRKLRDTMALPRGPGAAGPSARFSEETDRVGAGCLDA